MENTDLNKYIDEHEILYLIVADVNKDVLMEYGDKNKLLYDGLLKANFYDFDTIHELNKNLNNENLPQVFKQGKEVCLIGKPDEKNIVGIFYHEHRTPDEFIKWTKYLYNNLLQIWN